jgi:hypothetical protein
MNWANSISYCDVLYLPSQIHTELLRSWLFMVIDWLEMFPTTVRRFGELLMPTEAPFACSLWYSWHRDLLQLRSMTNFDEIHLRIQNTKSAVILKLTSKDGDRLDEEVGIPIHSNWVVISWRMGCRTKTPPCGELVWFPKPPNPMNDTISL